MRGERWSKIRTKGKSHYIFVDGAVKGGIIVALLVSYIQMVIDNTLTWNYLISISFITRIIMSLIVFPIGWALLYLMQWTIIEKKYNAPDSTSPNKTIKENINVSGSEKQSANFNVKPFIMILVAVIIIYIAGTIFFHTDTSSNSWIITLFSGILIGGLRGFFSKH